MREQFDFSRVYLIYIPNQGGWGVMDSCSCPDTNAFPSFMFKEYRIPLEKQERAFRRLLKAREGLMEKDVIPEKDSQNIFPELSDLIK